MNLEHLLAKEDLQILESIREFTKKEIMPFEKEEEAIRMANETARQ